MDRRLRSEELEQIKEILRLALREDLGEGDLTTSSLIPPEGKVRACYVSKAEGVLAGGFLIPLLFELTGAELTVEGLIEDGSRLEPGSIIATLDGNARSILQVERLSLNLIAKLSGIATLTEKFVRRVGGSGVEIYDTRKTTPCLRTLEKYAVRVGGGRNHRMGLYDHILIKDNHITALQRLLGVSRSEALQHALQAVQTSGKLVEVEVTSPEEALVAVRSSAKIIMLDNMPPEEMRRTISTMRQIRKDVIIEASGGVKLDTVREIAFTGVDRISVGQLTHSSPSLDISLVVV